MLNVRNCKECGKIFQYDGISKLCYECRKKDDENYKVVKEYLYENPKATIIQVSEATGVSEEKILRYLREGRLEITGDHPGFVLDCERCGKAIRTGRFCSECAGLIEREMKEGFKVQGRVHSQERMHIMDLRKKKK